MTFAFGKLTGIAASLFLVACGTSPGAQTATDTLDRKVIVLNATDTTMTRLYGSRESTDDWEENLLGADPVAAGDNLLVDFDDGTGACVFDIRAEFGDGTDLEEYGFNVCEETEFVIVEDDG